MEKLDKKDLFKVSQYAKNYKTGVTEIEALDKLCDALVTYQILVGRKKSHKLLEAFISTDNSAQWSGYVDQLHNAFKMHIDMRQLLNTQGVKEKEDTSLGKEK